LSQRLWKALGQGIGTELFSCISQTARSARTGVAGNSLGNAKSPAMDRTRALFISTDFNREPECRKFVAKAAGIFPIGDRL
jgi:hypothetical protein